MLKTKSWLVAGVAAVALAGVAAIAEAAPAMHEMTVQLPGGGVEHIRYTGNMKPEVVVMPNAAWADPFATAFVDPFLGYDRAFARMQQISMAMDHQMDAMLANAHAMQAAAQSGTLNATFGNLPPGTSAYTQISTWNGKNFCTRTVRMTSAGNGAKPQLVSNSSGDCGNQAAPSSTSVAIPAKAVATPQHAPSMRL